MWEEKKRKKAVKKTKKGKSQSVLQLLDDVDALDIEGMDSPSISRPVLMLCPFPISTPLCMRTHSAISMMSSSLASLYGASVHLKKLPHKSQEHAFSWKRFPVLQMALGGRAPSSSSPVGPLFHTHMKLICMMAQPTGSTTADDIIVILSDSDTPKMAPHSDIIDLT